MIKVYLKILISFVLLQLLISLAFLLLKNNAGVVRYVEILADILFPTVSMFVCFYKKNELRKKSFVADSIYALALAAASLFIFYFNQVHVLGIGFRKGFESDVFISVVIAAFVLFLVFTALLLQILLLVFSKKWKEGN